MLFFLLSAIFFSVKFLYDDTFFNGITNAHAFSIMIKTIMMFDTLKLATFKKKKMMHIFDTAIKAAFNIF